MTTLPDGVGPLSIVNPTTAATMTAVTAPTMPNVRPLRGTAAATEPAAATIVFDRATISATIGPIDDAFFAFFAAVAPFATTGFAIGRLLLAWDSFATGAFANG